MLHGLNNDYLYVAKKITTIITNGQEFRLLRGTGFFIKNGEKLILVTNRHMIEPGFGDGSLAGYKTIQFTIESYQSNDDSGRPSHLVRANIINIKDFVIDENPLNDIAYLFNAKVEGEAFTINTFLDYTMIADKNWFDKKLSVCDTIAYPGFPNWFDRKNNTPIFRMGTIASDPRFDYSTNPQESVETGAERVAYEGFSSGGASGSPVFVIQKGFKIGEGLNAPDDFYREVKMIGINAGHYTTVVVNDAGDPIDVDYPNNDELKESKTEGIVGHSGISYFYKSSAIINMIEKYK